MNVDGDTVIEQRQTWHDRGRPVMSATFERFSDDNTTTGALTAGNSYATADVSWYDGVGRAVRFASFGREDASSGFSHYVFDANGALIDNNQNGIPDVAENAPPQTLLEDSNSMAGIDFQLQVTQYNAAGNAYRSIDNLGRVTETQTDMLGRTVRTIQNFDNGTVEETNTVPPPEIFVHEMR